MINKIILASLTSKMMIRKTSKRLLDYDQHPHLIYNQICHYFGLHIFAVHYLFPYWCKARYIHVASLFAINYYISIN